MTNMPPEVQPPQPPPQAPPPPAQGGNDANQMAMLAHLLGIVGFIPSLVIWLVKKDVPFVEQEAKEALNFQITVAIAWIGTIIVSVISMFTCLHLFFLPYLLWAANIVFCILAAMKAKDGIAYRYPISLRLVK